jgi:hypothetical protein
VAISKGILPSKPKTKNAIKRTRYRVLLVFVSLKDSPNEKSRHLATKLEDPCFFKDEINMWRLIKRMVAPRNRGMRPGAELQPPGRGIAKDKRTIPTLNTIKRIETIKSIPAIASFLEFFPVSVWLFIFAPPL